MLVRQEISYREYL